MESRDIKRVDMIDATTDFCDLNTASTSGITNFALRLADVKAKRILIDGMNQLGGGSTNGVTIDVGLRSTLKRGVNDIDDRGLDTLRENGNPDDSCSKKNKAT